MQQGADLKKHGERRRHFRIDDRVFLGVRCISEDEANHFYLVNTEDIQENLRAIENQISVSLGDLSTSLPSLAELLSLLNRKINYALNDSSTLNEVTQEQGQYLLVNLSASGIAFPSQEELAEGQALALDLWLPSSDWRVAILGYVTGCVSTPDTGETPMYWVRVDFKNIDASVQGLLVQHLVKRQKQLIEQQIEEMAC